MLRLLNTAPVQRILPVMLLTIDGAVPKALLDGWCQLRVPKKTWFYPCVSCQIKIILITRQKSIHFFFRHKFFLEHLTTLHARSCSLFRVTTASLSNTTNLSTSWRHCRICFMIFICWKWCDISVDKTILITKRRNSLKADRGTFYSRCCQNKKIQILPSPKTHYILSSTWEKQFSGTCCKVWFWDFYLFPSV